MGFFDNSLKKDERKMIEGLTAGQRSEIRELLESGQKIAAIKRVMELLGLGLAQAKRLVEKKGFLKKL